jgi:hypothetical protein
MEDVLSVYERPYNANFPVVCMDEASRQLLGETRAEYRLADGSLRQDYEYVRHGEQKIFLATEPLMGWRDVRVSPHRTAVDWATFMAEVIIARYPEAQKIVLVCDNLNVHTTASFYEAYPPEQARRLAQRLEIHYTPKHGSWLDIAEIELSAMQKQCLKSRRIETAEELATQLKAWVVRRNRKQTTVDWQFTAADARTKLKRLYPKV